MEINTESQKHVLWGGEDLCDFLRVDRIVGRLLVEINEEGFIGKEGLRWLVR